MKKQIMKGHDFQIRTIQWTVKGRGARFLRLNWGPTEVRPWWCNNYFINFFNTKINIIHEENSTILTKIIFKKDKI